MRVLVTRPEPDASDEAKPSPRAGMRPCLRRCSSSSLSTNVALELDGAQALIVTSRNALRALATHRDLARARKLPLFAVGEATARAARSSALPR